MKSIFDYLKPLITPNPLISSTITKGIVNIGKKAVGIGEPGAGYIGKILPGVEKMTRLVEEKTPQPIKTYAKWLAEENKKTEWVMGKYTSEQLEYARQKPERFKIITNPANLRAIQGRTESLIAQGKITKEEAILFPATEVGFAITGMQDISRMSAKQLAPIMKQQAKVYFQKQGVISVKLLHHN